MNAPPDPALLEEVAIEMGIDIPFVEKDWYVTQLISVLVAIDDDDFTLVFTGGTSLAKAHHLISRFSEDVDFRVILKPGRAPATKSGLRKLLSKFKRKVIEHLRAELLFEDNKVTALNDNRFFRVELEYPTAYDTPGSLRPHLLLEFTYTDMLLPALVRSVSSLVNEYAKKAPEVPQVHCTDPVEIASDKVSAFTWRVAGRDRTHESDDPTIIRHLHDLASNPAALIQNANFRQMSLGTIEKDETRSDKLMGLSVKQKFIKVLKIIDADQEYANEYAKFVQGMSYAKKNVPDFNEARKQLQLLFDHISG